MNTIQQLHYFEEQSSGESNATQKVTWFQTLGNKIQAVSNAIHQKTLRGGANFIVVSPETATIIESQFLDMQQTTADGDAKQINSLWVFKK